MKKLFLCVLFLINICFANGLTFKISDALLPQNTPQTAFNLNSYLSNYLLQSPEVKTRKNSFAISTNNYKNTFISYFMPSFSASAGASNSYSRADRFSSLEDLKEWHSQGSLNGSWNLFNSGKDSLSYKKAHLTYQIAQIDFDSFMQNKVLSAVSNYYNLLLKQKKLAVYRDDVANTKKQYDQDKILYDNGLKTRSDLLSSETNWRSGQLSLFSAQSDYEDALSSFNISLNQPAETKITLAEDIDDSLFELPSLEEDLARALENRHDIRRSRLELEEQDLSFKQNKLNTLPSLSVDLFGSTGRSFDRHEVWDYNYGISAGVSFDFGFFYIDKKRERENYFLTNQNAHLNYEETLRHMRDDIVSVRNNLILKMQSLEISALRLEAATQKFEATQTKYQNGLMSATDLTFARQEMVSAQINHLTLITDLAIAKLRYQYAIGQNIFEYSLEDLK